MVGGVAVWKVLPVCFYGLIQEEVEFTLRSCWSRGPSGLNHSSPREEVTLLDCEPSDVRVRVFSECVCACESGVCRGVYRALNVKDQGL